MTLDYCALYKSSYLLPPIPHYAIRKFWYLQNSPKSTSAWNFHPAVTLKILPRQVDRISSTKLVDGRACGSHLRRRCCTAHIPYLLTYLLTQFFNGRMPFLSPNQLQRQSIESEMVRCWCGYLSGARCRLAYGPADATATHCLLLQ